MNFLFAPRPNARRRANIRLCRWAADTTLGALCIEKPLARQPVLKIESRPHRMGGAYWMPPAFHNWLSPRGMASWVFAPRLRSKTSP
jgi:hypothetical protein